MTPPPGPASAPEVVAAFERRVGPGRELADQAGQIAGAAHAMALRFHQGGKLLVFGTGAASTDAQHVAVEFVHPVIVGKRALPAISLTSDAATVTGVAAREGFENVFAHQIRYLAEPADIALGISPDGACPSVLGGLRAASELGMLTVALAGGEGGTLASGRARWRRARTLTTCSLRARPIRVSSRRFTSAPITCCGNSFMSFSSSLACSDRG